MTGQQRSVSSPEYPRLNVLGVGISAINIAMALQAIDAWIAHRDRAYVCVAAVHSVMESRRDPPLRKVLNRSGMTTPDGMPLVWLARMAGHRHVERVYGPDLMLATSAHSIDKGYRHFLCGGAPGVPEALAARLEHRFSGLKVVGTFSPPFGDMAAEESAALDARINASGADIVWVGLGTGRQEHWMAQHRATLEAPVLIGVGAAFDFLSGRKAQAPPWMRRAGLEWVFRLLSEPRRLWPRYREYPLFVLLLAGQLLHLRSYPLDR